MTKIRNDNHSTEFGLWLRQQRKIDSALGFIATNLDYIWENYNTGEWMLIEEKRFSAIVSFSQKKQFQKLHAAIKDPLYRGFHLLQFEHTNPDDGWIKWDHQIINSERLFELLLFVKK